MCVYLYMCIHIHVYARVERGMQVRMSKCTEVTVLVVVLQAKKHKAHIHVYKDRYM